MVMNWFCLVMDLAHEIGSFEQPKKLQFGLTRGISSFEELTGLKFSLTPWIGSFERPMGLKFGVIVFWQFLGSNLVVFVSIQ